jgi:NAD+ kinase
MSTRVGLRGRELDGVEKSIRSLDAFDIVEEAPDLVVTHGGDGALLGAEYEFPGVPKLPIRDAKAGPLCPEHDSVENSLLSFEEGRSELTELPKLEGAAENVRITGINDVFIHNVDRVGALRYRVLIDDEPYGHEIIGDGVGVATVHGSTAYYRSITHSIFKIGIGLAFSNSTEVTNHLVLPENSVVTVKVVRGPGLLVADNRPDIIEIPNGGVITIRRIGETALIYGLDAFMCPKCRRLRHPREW